MRSFDWRLFSRVAARITVALAIATASFIVFAQSSQLRLVSTVWPPFTNQPDSRVLRSTWSRRPSAVSGSPPRRPSSMPRSSRRPCSAGISTAAPRPGEDPERDRVLLFSQPYLENRLVLVGRKGSDVSAPALTALKGKRIAIVGGYSYGNAIDETTATFVRSRSEEDSLALLLGGSVDYALMDELVVQYLVNNYPKEAQSKLQLGTMPLVTRELHLAIRRTRPDAESIISRFNAQLRGMIADHTYHRLLHVAWIRADVDGDGIPEFVPQSDRPGPLQPQHAYTLFSNPQPTSQLSVEQPTTTQPRFYVGGNIYTDWAAVPSRYKADDQKHPDSSRSTASIFRFSW